MKTSKKSKIFLIVIFSVIGFLFLIWLGLNFSKYLIYRDYMSQRENVCDIPDLNSGFTPQGIGYSTETDSYLMTGYDGDNIVLYIIKDNQPKKLNLADENGDILKGHGGGVTCVGNYVYVADGGYLYVFNFSDIQIYKNEDKISCIKKVSVDNKASFCFSDENYIYVGEFYRKGNYETDSSHYYTTPSGEEHKAIVLCYDLNKNGEISENYPEYSISVTDLVQGIAVKDDIVILSRSWGLSSSTLEFYDGIKDSGKTVSVSGKSVPLYYIDSTNLRKSVSLPFFSEDLTVVNNRVVINFESACNKYMVGKLFFATKATSYPIFDYED